LALGRVVELQVVEGAEFQAQAAQNKYLFYKVQSDRGIIYDSDFNPLVENLSTFDLQCIDEKMPAGPEKKALISGLAAVAEIDAGQIENAIAGAKIPTVENLGHQALIVLEARIAVFSGMLHCSAAHSRLCQRHWFVAFAWIYGKDRTRRMESGNEHLFDQ
jgi:Cell division protein FtsI/penicillin-binding protein 2